MHIMILWKRGKGTILCLFSFILTLTGSKRVTLHFFFSLLSGLYVFLSPPIAHAYCIHTHGSCSAAGSFLSWNHMRRSSIVPKHGRIHAQLMQSQSAICVNFVWTKDCISLVRLCITRLSWHRRTLTILMWHWTGTTCNVYAENTMPKFMTDNNEDIK